MMLRPWHQGWSDPPDQWWSEWPELHWAWPDLSWRIWSSAAWDWLQWGLGWLVFHGRNQWQHFLKINMYVETLSIWLAMRLTCVALSTELIIRTVEWNNVGEEREEEGGEDAGGHQVEIFLSHKLKRDLMEQTGGDTQHTNQQSLKSCHRNWSISCFTVLFLPFILKPSTFLPMQTNSQNLRKLMKPSTTARASLST